MLECTLSGNYYLGGSSMILKMFNRSIVQSFNRSIVQSFNRPQHYNLTGCCSSHFNQPRSTAARSRLVVACLMLGGLLVLGSTQSAKAQSLTLTDDNENIYQIVDICRLEAVFRVDPGSDSAYAFTVFLEINGSPAVANTNYLQVAISTTLPDNGVGVVRSTENLRYINHLRAVVPQSREDVLSPFDVTLYFTLPRNAPNTEFALVATGGPSTQAYSIAEHCPKGN